MRRGRGSQHRLGVGANSPIYFSQSTDGGITWSAGIEISGASATAWHLQRLADRTPATRIRARIRSWTDGTIYVVSVTATRRTSVRTGCCRLCSSANAPARRADASKVGDLIDPSAGPDANAA
jgi:hypothetical protein